MPKFGRVQGQVGILACGIYLASSRQTLMTQVYEYICSDFSVRHTRRFIELGGERQ